MTKESLSDKMFETLNETGKNVIWIEDVKEKIQNAQRRIKDELVAEVSILPPELKNKAFKVQLYHIIPRIIEKIFLEEFGGKLTK